MKLLLNYIKVNDFVFCLGSGHAAITWLCVEAALVICQAAGRRGFEVAESFLGTLLGHRVNVMILEKAKKLKRPLRNAVLVDVQWFFHGFSRRFRCFSWHFQ